MQHKEVAKLARELMDKHGLKHWLFKLDRAKRRAGCCMYKRQTITLSYYYVSVNNDEDIRDTILHEIAHALVGKINGQWHGERWKEVCVQIGAKPIRCYGKHVVMPKGKWQATCSGCKRVFHHHRRPKYIVGCYCLKCGPVVGQLRFAIAENLMVEQ